MTTTTTQTIDEVRDEVKEELARREFLTFLDFVYIQDPPVPNNPQPTPILKFKQWPHLMEIALTFVTDLLIVVLKARQLGFSWIAAAYALWTAMYKPGAVVLLISKGELEAIAFLEKCKTIHRLLKPSLQVTIQRQSRTELVFEFSDDGTTSKISALPSTENAGRSETSSLVIQDEADFHDHLAENFVAIKPTIDAGGQLIMGSTSNKLKMITTFKGLFKEAPGNGWKALFFGWMVRPGRTEEWYERTKRSAPTTERLTPDLYMEQEYPATANEALAPARALAAFTRAVLIDMQEDTRRPVPRMDGDPYSAEIFVRPAVGRRYCAFSDTGHGVGLDFHCTGVMDARAGMIVAHIFNNTMPVAEFTAQSILLLKLYGNPIWGIEENDWGGGTLMKAQELGYKKIWADPDKHGGDKPGWHTSEATRMWLYGELLQAIEDRQIIVPSEAGLAQFFSMVRNPLKHGRIEALSGTHDDYPLMVGGCWLMRQYVHTSSGGKGVPIPLAY